MLLMLATTGAPPRGGVAGDRDDLFLMHLVFDVVADDARFLLRFFVEKLAGEPAEDIIHDRFGHRDIGILGEARRLEAHMAELVD